MFISCTGEQCRQWQKAGRQRLGFGQGGGCARAGRAAGKLAGRKHLPKNAGACVGRQCMKSAAKAARRPAPLQQGRLRQAGAAQARPCAGRCLRRDVHSRFFGLAAGLPSTALHIACDIDNALAMAAYTSLQQNCMQLVRGGSESNPKRKLAVAPRRLACTGRPGLDAAAGLCSPGGMIRWTGCTLLNKICMFTIA